MCPVCISAAAVVAASTTSGGGISAVVWRVLRKKRGAKKASPKTNPKEEIWDK